MIYRTTLKRDGKPLASMFHTDLSRPKFDDMGRETAHALKKHNATHFRTDALIGTQAPAGRRS
jgi:hypothetical protein